MMRIIILALFDIEARRAGRAGRPCLSLSLSFSAFISRSASQPFAHDQSLNASYVPLVDGGPNTEMATAGSAGLTSFHVLAVLGWP